MIATHSPPPITATPPQPRHLTIYAFPLFLTLLAIFIATAAAKAGAQTGRQLENYRISRNIADLRYQLACLAPSQRDAPHPYLPESPRVQDLQRQLAAALQEQPRRPLQPGMYFTNWDAFRYEDILSRGYLYDKAAVIDRHEVILYDPRYQDQRLVNVVWYPLYPLLGKLVATLTGLAPHQALTLVSQLSTILASLLLFTLARNHFASHSAFRIPHSAFPNSALPSVLSPQSSVLSDPRSSVHSPDHAALLTLAFLLFNPVAIFLYSNFTEGLFVLLLSAFLLCLQKERFLLAAFVAGIASASRSQGVLFGPFLTLILLFTPNLSALPLLPRLLKTTTLALLSELGLLCYMLYLHLAFHDPLAFMHAQAAWNVGIDLPHLLFAFNPLNSLHYILTTTLAPTPDYPRIFESWCILLPPILLLLFRKHLTPTLTLIAWTYWLLPFISNCNAGNPPGEHPWMSMARFTLTNLPLHLLLTTLLLRRPRTALLLLLLSTATFTLFSYIAGMGIWLG